LAADEVPPPRKPFLLFLNRVGKREEDPSPPQEGRCFSLLEKRFRLPWIDSQLSSRKQFFFMKPPLIAEKIGSLFFLRDLCFFSASGSVTTFG